MSEPMEYPPGSVIVRMSFRDVASGETSIVSTTYVPAEGASSVTRLDLIEMAGESLVRQLAEELHLHRYAAQAQTELRRHNEVKEES